MRGDVWSGAAPTESPDKPILSSATTTEPTTGSNIGENTQLANKPGSVWWWIALLGLYLGLDYLHTRGKVLDALKPSNIRANAHNLAIIGLAALIFVNGANVLLTKLAAMKIPGISKAAGTFLPLVHL